jgi:hypothetical protein
MRMAASAAQVWQVSLLPRGARMVRGEGFMGEELRTLIAETRRNGNAESVLEKVLKMKCENQENRKRSFRALFPVFLISA